MTPAQSLLLQFIVQSPPSFKKELRGQFLESLGVQVRSFSPEQSAGFFVDVTFLGSALRFLQDEQWLMQKEGAAETSGYGKFLESAFASNLQSLQYLQSALSVLSIKDLRRLAEMTEDLEKVLIKMIQDAGVLEQRQFMTEALQLMVQVFQHENTLLLEGNVNARSLTLSLYRTFDGLDQIFGLDYEADIGMKTDIQLNERLYEGAGIGVQSSYSTLLTALRETSPSAGSRFIDLGSGYGRVGLVVGLLRPDIDFIGYEYVKHRVDISNVSTEKFGLEDHVHFFTQDLSEKAFKIPEAEVYYMFDPFSQETYQHVLNQLVEVARKQRIVVVTKGNARHWLKEIAQKEGWLPAQEFDGGNLGVFRSRA